MTDADCIDLLILAVDRMVDELEHAKHMLPLEDQEWVDEPEIEIPDPDTHQKNWTQVSAIEVAREIEKRYEKSERTRIPERFTTPY